MRRVTLMSAGALLLVVVGLTSPGASDIICPPGGCPNPTFERGEELISRTKTRAVELLVRQGQTHLEAILRLDPTDFEKVELLVRVARNVNVQLAATHRGVVRNQADAVERRLDPVAATDFESYVAQPALDEISDAEQSIDDQISDALGGP